MPVEYFWATGTDRPITELSEFEYLHLAEELKKLDSLVHRCGLQLLEFHEEDTYILIFFFFDSLWGAEDTPKREEVKATWCLSPMDCKKAMGSTNWVRAVALTHRDLVKELPNATSHLSRPALTCPALTKDTRSFAFESEEKEIIAKT
ncbi:hypothetical protein FB451DRAFT_1188348 [Mycena latifolia]|nr:hypothetical protein FB451DRAFT_1188348 [Mycena latifolia]